MKNLKYIIYFFSLALIFSCGEDDVDSITNPGTFTDSNQVNIGFTDSNDGMLLLENGGTVTYTVTLSEALAADATVSFAMSSSDGSAEASFSSVVISAGSTSADVTVTFTDDGQNDSAGEVNTFTIANVEYPSSPTVYLTYDGSSRTSNVFDTLPLIIDTTPGDVAIRLDWAGSEDLDLYLRDEPGFAGGNPNIDFSWFSQPETMTMPGALADGEYYIGVDNFNVTPPYSVACTLVVTFPDAQSELLISELTDFIWIKVTKETTPTGVRYLINI